MMDCHSGIDQQRLFTAFQQEKAYHAVFDPPCILIHLSYLRAVLLSASAADSGVDGDNMAALPAGPLPALFLQKSFHAQLPDIAKILFRRLAERILRCIAGFLLRYVFTRIIRTFIAIIVSVFFPFAAENDTALFRTEFRFVLIRPVAAGTGIRFCQRPFAEAAVKPAGGNHFSGNLIVFHRFSPFSDLYR